MDYYVPPTRAPKERWASPRFSSIKKSSLTRLRYPSYTHALQMFTPSTADFACASTPAPLANSSVTVAPPTTILTMLLSPSFSSISTINGNCSRLVVFRAEVYINDDKVAEAEGRSKKEAKRKEAKKALFLITN